MSRYNINTVTGWNYYKIGIGRYLTTSKKWRKSKIIHIKLIVKLTNEIIY